MLNKNRFSFFVADYLQVGQLCTNPKSDRSLLSCLKVIQCSTSEIGDARQHNICSLPIQVMKTGPLPAPSKCKSGRFNAWGHSSTHQTTLRTAMVMVFGVFSCEDHIMPPHIFEVGLKVNAKVYLDVLKSVVITWCNQVAGGRPWVWQPAHKSKETQAWLQKECYDFVTFSRCNLPPPIWTRWTASFGHTSRQSPTWPSTTPKPVRSPPSAEYSSSSRQRLWKGHAPSSGSLSRRWLRLKTLNRCQLYYIIKLPELIFLRKFLK